MSFSSQAGLVSFETQATPGVFPADFATVSESMKLRSGALGPNRDLLITDPEIGGGRDVSDAYLGAVHWSGDYEFYVRLDSLITLLKAGLGSSTTSTTTGVSTHTFTPLDSATLPSIAIEEDIGGATTNPTLECYQYTDAVVNTLHFESEANGYFMGTAGIIAKKQIAGATPIVAPTIDGSFLIVGTNISVTYNAVTLPARSFGFDLTNNVADDDTRLGSFYLGDLTAKRRELTGTVHIRPQDSALWRQAVYGTSGATQAGGLTTKNQLVITATTYEDIPSGTPPTKASMTITIPKVILQPFGLTQSGDDIIENDVTWQAVRPAAGTPLCTVVVKTGKATIA